MKNKFYKVLLFSTLVLFSNPLIAKIDSTVMVGFYNLENLFDTVHDFNKKDYEYLPGNSRGWDSTKYYQKLNHLARSIASMNSWEGPDFLGLCEVENVQCLRDLLNKTNLKSFGYDFVHKESYDERGIDVACIFKRDKFKFLDKEFVKVNLGTGNRPTRDVLIVKLLLAEDTVQVFVNHWPSRFGGELSSRDKRKITAQKVRLKLDSLFMLDPKSKIILLGDFNDGPLDKSIEILQDHKVDTNYILHNTSLPLFQKGEGTHKHQDEWNLFDQIIVSKSLVNSGGRVKYVPLSFMIHNKKEWLSELDLVHGGVKPFRSFYGKKFINGYSDHYAVSVKLTY